MYRLAHALRKNFLVRATVKIYSTSLLHSTINQSSDNRRSPFLFLMWTFSRNSRCQLFTNFFDRVLMEAQQQLFIRKADFPQKNERLKKRNGMCQIQIFCPFDPSICDAAFGFGLWFGSLDGLFVFLSAPAAPVQNEAETTQDPPLLLRLQVSVEPDVDAPVRSPTTSQRSQLAEPS